MPPLRHPIRRHCLLAQRKKRKKWEYKGENAISESQSLGTVYLLLSDFLAFYHSHMTFKEHQSGPMAAMQRWRRRPQLEHNDKNTFLSQQMLLPAQEVWLRPPPPWRHVSAFSGANGVVQAKPRPMCLSVHVEQVDMCQTGVVCVLRCYLSFVRRGCFSEWENLRVQLFLLFLRGDPDLLDTNPTSRFDWKGNE